MKQAIKIILPVIVKGRGKIDEVFKDPERTPSVPDEGKTQAPFYSTYEDEQLMHIALVVLELSQSKHPVRA